VVREAILAEEIERGQNHPDGQDLSTELDKAPTHANYRLQVMRIFGVLVDLGILPVQNIPQLPKSAREVLPAVDLILQCLQEALASSTGPWD
jgi:hypothetical protein